MNDNIKRNMMAFLVGFIITAAALILILNCGDGTDIEPPPVEVHTAQDARPPCVHSYEENCDEFGEFKGGPYEGQPHPDLFFKNSIDETEPAEPGNN